jgi:hypothetical protein
MRPKRTDATTATFQVRPDGLYYRLDDGEWHRVAKKLAAVSLTFRFGQLEIGQIALPTRRSSSRNLQLSPDLKSTSRQLVRKVHQKLGSAEIETAIQQISIKLSERENIIDLTERKQAQRSGVRSDQALGFVVNIPTIGRAFVIKRQTLSDWITGPASSSQILDALSARGLLIPGADGKRTRQVLIAGCRRSRYYCLKMKAAAQGVSKLPTPTRSSDVSRDPIESGLGASSTCPGHAPANAPANIRRKPIPKGDWTDDCEPESHLIPEPRTVGSILLRSGVRF